MYDGVVITCRGDHILLRLVRARIIIIAQEQIRDEIGFRAAAAAAVSNIVTTYCYYRRSVIHRSRATIRSTYYYCTRYSAEMDATKTYQLRYVIIVRHAREMK